MKELINSKFHSGGLVHLALQESLLRLNCNFSTEKVFLELPRKRFDFYLPEKKLLVEVQGSQHFFLTTKFKSSVKLSEEGAFEELKRGISSDNSKIEFCKEKGLDLVWITTEEDLNLFFEDYLKGSFSQGLFNWFHRGHLDLSLKDTRYYKNYHKSLKDYLKLTCQALNEKGYNPIII